MSIASASSTISAVRDAVHVFFAQAQAQAQAQAHDPATGYKLALVGTVLAAAIGAAVTISVAVANNSNQRRLAFAAAKAEAEATRSENAARATETALAANKDLIAGLQLDNDRLRRITRECETKCDEVRDEMYETEAKFEALKLKNTRDEERIAHLEDQVQRLEGNAS